MTTKAIPIRVLATNRRDDVFLEGELEKLRARKRMKLARKKGIPKYDNHVVWDRVRSFLATKDLKTMKKVPELSKATIGIPLESEEIFKWIKTERLNHRARVWVQLRTKPNVNRKLLSMSRSSYKPSLLLSKWESSWSADWFRKKSDPKFCEFRSLMGGMKEDCSWSTIKGLFSSKDDFLTRTHYISMDKKIIVAYSPKTIRVVGHRDRVEALKKWLLCSCD